MVKSFKVKCPYCGAVIIQGSFPRTIYVCPSCKRPLADNKDLKRID